MSDKVLIGSNVIAEPENTDDLFTDIYIRFSVNVVGSFNRTSVRQQVEAVIRKVLHFDSVDFGTRVTMGAIYRAALSVQGVEWGELHWLSTTAPPPEDQPTQLLQITPFAGTSPPLPPAQPLFSGTWQHSSTHTVGDPTAQRLPH